MLAALPVVTEFLGKSLLDGAALDAHYGWLPAVFVISSMVTGGAVLRVAGRVFCGWGPTVGRDEGKQERAARVQDEERGAAGRTPPLMVIVPGVLLFAAIVVGLIPGADARRHRTRGSRLSRSSRLHWLGPGGHATALRPGGDESCCVLRLSLRRRGERRGCHAGGPGAVRQASPP